MSAHRPRMFSNNTSKFRGVAFAKGRGYRAFLGSSGKRYSSPYFPTAIEAAVAYNRLARLHHGVNAQLNVIPEDWAPPPPHECVYLRLGKLARRFTPPEDALMERLRISGLSTPEIAKQMGRNRGSVLRRLGRLAIRAERGDWRVQ